MRTLTRIREDEQGVSLVELLVVVAITVVVGLVVTSGMSSAVRATTQTQRRIDALTDLQRAVARVGREVRAARPLCSASNATRIVAVVDRGTERHRYTYEIVTASGATTLRETREIVSGTGSASCTASAASTRQVTAATDVVSATIFTYHTSTGAATTDATAAAEVAITLRRAITSQQPLRVDTRVSVRNLGLPG